MNRRHFIQTLASVPLLSQFLPGSQKACSSTALYLISDSPHHLLPALLEELKKLTQNKGNKFSLLKSSPYEKQIIKELRERGWIFSPVPNEADLFLSFRILKHKTRPSFTLAKNGKAWDIRSQSLFSLWREINKKQELSSTLTIASFSGAKTSYIGKSISVFNQGKKVDSLRLDANKTKFYKAKQGRIVMSVNNGKAWVKDSSCRHKICCLTPPISLAGERIICAPNGFLVGIDRTSLIDTSIG